MSHLRRNMGEAGTRVHGARGLRGAVAALCLLAAACTPPDTPPALSRNLPDGALELLEPDEARSARIAAGVWYRYAWSAKGPWAVHTVEADLSRCDLGLSVLQSEERESGGRGFETVTSMVARQGSGVLAAVNADFFTAEGRTVGAEVVDGWVSVSRERPTVAWRPGNAPWMGRAEVRGDSLVLGWSVHRRDGDGLTQAVGGDPDLIDDGDWVGDLTVDARPGFAASRHPRTAVGYNAEAQHLWLVVVDGRQSPHSAGMTLPELASLMEALGATEALNLDGGGSTAMVVAGETLNSPSDQTGERPVVNALAVVRDFSRCGG